MQTIPCFCAFKTTPTLPPPPLAAVSCECCAGDRENKHLTSLSGVCLLGFSYPAPSRANKQLI
jgi:hypothetical protein